MRSVLVCNSTYICSLRTQVGCIVFYFIIYLVYAPIVFPINYMTNIFPYSILNIVRSTFHLTLFLSGEILGMRLSACTHGVLATDLRGGSVWFGGSTEMGPVVHRFLVKSRAWVGNILIKSGGLQAMMFLLREREKDPQKKIWGPAGIQTQDLLNTSQTLLPLSHLDPWQRSGRQAT